MLTYADRAYLLGESTPETAAAERKKRQRIRRRIRETIVDFTLLVHLPWADFELVFSDLVDEGEIADTELYDGLVDMIEVVMRGVTMQGVPFERLLELATLRSIGVYHLVSRGWLVAVECDSAVRVIPERSLRLADVDESVRMADIPLAAALALEEFGITTHEALCAAAEVAREGDPIDGNQPRS